MKPAGIILKDDIISALRHYFASREDVPFAYLFGSYSRGKQKEDSDIDIAVYLSGISEDKFFECKLDFKTELEEIFKKPVDVVIMNSAPPLLNHEIFKDGILIKNADPSFLSEFRMKNFYFYLDQMYIINTYLESTKERIKENSIIKERRQTYMVRREIISKKVNLIRYHLERITSKSNISLEEFLSNDDVKDIICHNLFIVLQYVIDICNHIIADEGMEEPLYLSDMADILAKEKVIRRELVKPLKGMIGLRNLLAHQYGDLDFKEIYNIVKNDLKDVNAFLEDIIGYSKL